MATRACQAFLGYENRFVFDRTRQIWVLEDELPLMSHEAKEPLGGGAGSSRPDTPDRDRGGLGIGAAMAAVDTPASVEEHGLVLAIQAAHYAERLKREGITSPKLAQYGALGGVTQGVGPSSRGLRSASASSVPGSERPPSYLVAQMVFLYGAWCGMQLAVEAMLPVWMLTSVEMGAYQHPPPLCRLLTR